MKKVLFATLFILIAIYGVFQARKLIEGPIVVVVTPEDGSTVALGVVRISGMVKNISFLTINDKRAFTDEHGNFAETISPAIGYTVIVVAVVDRFGRKVHKVVSVNVTR